MPDVAAPPAPEADAPEAQEPEITESVIPAPAEFQESTPSTP